MIKGGINLTLIQYTMQPGDTLWGLAQKFNSSVDDIARYNAIDNVDNIPIGQEILIPVIDLAVPRWYVVRPGDSVFDIGRRYGLTVPDILQFNFLPNPDLIYPGQVLRLKK